MDFNIGYALSGGFIKGFAHLGIMQALLEHDIKPDVISGVSAGSLAGVFYADGNEPYKVLDFFSGHKFQDLTKLVIPKVGLFELGEFQDFLRSNLKAQKLEELKTPLMLRQPIWITVKAFNSEREAFPNELRLRVACPSCLLP